MNTKTTRKSKYVSTLLISFLLSLGFLLLLTPLPVHAFTNSFTQLAISANCFGSCTNPFLISGGTVATTNDLLVVTVGCETGSNVFSITDTLGNSWASANSQHVPFTVPTSETAGATGAGPTTGNGIAEIWFSSPSPTGSDTITITFNQTNQFCVGTLSEGNTPSIAVNTGTSTLATFSEPSTASDGVTSQVSNSYSSVPANSITFSLGFLIGISGVGTQSTITVNPSQTPVGTKDGAYDYIATASTFVSSSQQVVISDTYTHKCCQSGGGNHDQEILMSVVFAQQGILTGKAASSFYEGCTHAAAITTGEAITGNTTIYYPFWTTAAPETWKNVTVDIKSVALTNGQTSALMFVGVYTSTNAEPFGQGPSNNDNWFLFSSDSVTLTNNATPRNITFNAPASMGGNSNKGIAVGVFVSHNGVTLRRASSHTSFMAFDNSTVASGNPNKLQQFNKASSNNQACFRMLVSTPSVSQTFTFTTQAASTTITTTSITTVTIAVATITQQVTSTIYSLQGGQGGSAILEDILTFSPIIILPLFMGGLFGMIGVFIGLILGVVIGGQLGIVPQWVIFLLIAAIFYIIVRREV